MSNFRWLWSMVLPIFLMVTMFVSTGEAATYNVQNVAGRTPQAKAVIDDSTPYTGLYSFIVDGTELVWQQQFWYRIGSTGGETSIDGLTLKSVVAPTTASPNTLSLTYTLTGTFDIKIDYKLTYSSLGVGPIASMQRTVTITNTSTGNLDYHLFDYSDFEISQTPTPDDSIEVVNGKIYQKGTQAAGYYTTIVHQSTPLANAYDIDNNQTYYLPDLKDATPTVVSTPQTPYSYGDDMQFIQQWDLTIPAGTSKVVSTTDTVYYAAPITAAKTHADSCLSYGGQANYSIAFDNLGSSEALTGIKIIDRLPLKTTIGTTPPSSGGTYDAPSNTVTWNIANLAAGAAPSSVQLSAAVNSPTDITNEALLVSDQTFPTRISDPAVLCNHPPSMNSIPNLTMDAGGSFTYQVVASDPDKTVLKYSLTNAPAGMSISSTGLISWASGVAGTYTITVTATDSGTAPLLASRTFTLTVNKVNVPPVITSTPKTTATTNQIYIYTVTATDADGDPLTYNLAGAPLGMSISGNVIMWQATKAQVPSQAVKVMVTDGTNYVYQDFTIAVTYVNNAPVISLATPPATTATVDTAYTYQVSATDPDNDALYYSLIASPDPVPAGMTIGTGGMIRWIPTAAQNNMVHKITAQVSDNLGGIATFSFSVVVGTSGTKVTPTITWATPAAITYGTALSATQLNATSGGVAGTFTYSPASGEVLNAGSQNLTATFTPTDTTTYNTATKTVTLTVNPASATVALAGLSQTYDGTAKSATATTTPAGKTVAITYAGSATAPTAAGTYAVVATITDPNYLGGATGTLTIAKATPTITWTTPAPIIAGTALSATQLNATASVNGSFTYTPASGTAMNTAGAQTLSVAFTPTDTTNYNGATKTVNITVNTKTTPTITWATPAAITYGTALSATQLNATSGGVAGTFTYSPAISTVLNAGSQNLTATFTPTDTTTYNTTTKTVTLTVNKAAATVTLAGLTATYNGSAKTATAATTPAGLSVAITYAGSATAPTAAGSYAVVATITDTNYTGSATGTLTIAKATPAITWAAPAPVFVGTALSATLLNATANVPGSFVYTPALGTVLNTAGAQTLSVAFTPTDAANYNNASATVSLTVNSKQNPTITWNNPAAITYGTTLSATQLNATASVAGTFVYTPAAGTVLNAGTQTLSVTFNPTNTTTYNSVTKTVTLTVNKAAATVTLAGLTATYNGSAKTATAATTPAGLSVAITYAGSATAPTVAGSYAVVATITDTNYTGSATGTLTIAKATPAITWAAPAPVFVGTALSATQLNASSTVAGTFVYTPVSGTVMNTAGTQTLKADFTPTDAVNYSTASATVSLTVSTKTTPTITWATPAAITYGTALSATQLNATSGGVAGTFTYSPAISTVLNAGSQNLTATFTPTDTTTYNTTTKTVTLTVNKAAATVTLAGLTATYNGSAKAVTAATSPAGLSVAITYAGSATAPTAAGSYAVVATVSDANYTGTANGTLVIAKATPTITWAVPAPITVGTALSATQLNATANVPGSFVYTPALGTVLNTAGAQTLSVAFTPTDAANYNNASATVSLTVNSKQNPTITWNNPAAITYGTTLSATQLNATASVAGTFVYTPAAGTVLNAGTQTLSVTFNPTNTTTYNSVTKTVTLTVNKAAATVTLAGLTATYNGSAKTATAATTPAGLSVAITYAGSATAPTAAGSYAVVATITDTNYIGSATGTLTIAKATPAITWAAPTPVFVGTALSATQLNASSTIAGTFVYTPVSGTVMNTAGTQTLKADFTPTDAVNYSTASATVSLTVSTKTTPTITWATPTAITYGTALSATQLNATSGGVAGTFTYSPAISTVLNAGSQNLTATFTPTDTTTYNTTTKTVTLTVNKAAATVTLAGLTATYNGSAKTVTAATTPAGLSVAITYAGSATAPTAAGSYAVVATVSDANYTGTANGTLVIAKATPTITWAAPAPITAGTALSTTQLNATANVPGTFIYTPALGTVMNTAGTQTLSVAFTPTDANYNNATATVALTVNPGVKQDPTITWNNPAAITYGTALSATQLNATTSVAGTFIYTPAAGTVLNAGTQTLSVTFNPTDTTTYNSVSKTVTLTVNKAAATIAISGLSQTYSGTAKSVTTTTTPAGLISNCTYNGSTTLPTAAGSYVVVCTITDDNYTGTATFSLVISKAASTITWATPAPITAGTALSATQLNATANVPGSFVYTPALGTVMNTAGTPALAVAFTPTDAANYSNASATVSLTVNQGVKQDPTITWNNPAAITYGTALSAAQLNATASVAGTFVYTPATGTILNAGNQTLSVTFNPTDTVTYNSVSKTVTLTVNQAAASVTLSGLTTTYSGTAKSATATTSPAGLPVAITYAGSATAPTAAGTYPVVATVTDTNYTGSANGTLVISKAASTITWATPAPITVGTALSATQLNATANVPGTFVYTPASGTVMNAVGIQTLSATFTPADNTNYTAATTTVALTVNSSGSINQPPVISSAPLLTAYKDGYYYYQVAASDPNGDKVTLSLTTRPSGMAIDTNTGIISWRPSDSGYFSVSIKATNSTGLSTTQSFKVYVRDSSSSNSSPKITSTAVTTAVAGVPYTYDVNATDYNGDTLYYRLYTAPTGMSINLATGVINWTPAASQVGSQNVSIMVVDSKGGKTYQNFYIKVTAATLEKPVITWAAPTPVLVGTVLSSAQLNAQANVPGTFSYTPPAGTVMNTAGVQALSVLFTPSDTTTYSSASATVGIAVNPEVVINKAPVFTSTASLPAGNNSSSYSFQAKATDPEMDTIVYTLANAPSGMTIGTTSGLINWSTPVVGSYNFSIIADDGKGGNTVQSATLSISGATVNLPPVITSLPVTIGYRNISYRYGVQANDPNGNSLRFTLSKKPSGMTINSSTGFISWVPSSEGNYAVTVKVTDSMGASAFQNFTISVKPRGAWTGSSVRDKH